MVSCRVDKRYNAHHGGAEGAAGGFETKSLCIPCDSAVNRAFSIFGFRRSHALWALPIDEHLGLSLKRVYRFVSGAEDIEYAVHAHQVENGANLF